MESKLRAAKSNSKDKSANLESKSKDKYKSPSELKRSHRRLREYLHENYSQEKECQTSLETSDCPTQASAVTCDKQSQTAKTFSPPRLESNALKVACTDDLLHYAITCIRMVDAQKDLINRYAESQQKGEAICDYYYLGEGVIDTYCKD